MPNNATPMRRYSTGSTRNPRSMHSLTRKPTPNNDSTTPTLTGTLPVVNQRTMRVKKASTGDGSTARCAAAGRARASVAAAVVAGDTRAGAGGGAAAAAAAGAGTSGTVRS